MVAVASPSVVEACLSELANDIDALDADHVTALMASSSRLGLSQISRRLPSNLLAAAVNVSLPVGLLIAHHVNILSDGPNLLTVFTPETAARAARFGPAGWPALHIAGISLIKTPSPDWLAVLDAHGPSAESDNVSGSLPDGLCERVLNNSALYPTRWVLIAEASRSRLNAEQPLQAAAGAWFQD